MSKEYSNNTERFLSHFFGNQIFVSKPDGKGLDPKKSKPKPIHYHAKFQRCCLTLQKQNDVFWGIYFTVNDLDRQLDPEHQRTIKMVTRARAIWIEDDKKRTKPRTDFPIEPNIIVKSSPGKFHYYWLTSTNRLDEWKGVMSTMVSEYGCDDNAKDLARIMRLPGFNHQKADPFMSVFSVQKADPYSWGDIVRNFPVGDFNDSKSSTNKSKPETESDHINNIIKAKNFHGSFQKIAASMANRTLHKPTILQHLRGVGFEALVTGISDPERESRLKTILSPNDDELNDVVDWAVDRTIEERDDDAEQVVAVPDNVDIKVRNYELVWPPGLMGGMCKEIYEMAPHPNKEIAIMCGFSMVAGIIGRKYNVNGMGLNIYIALLADSGIGKANLKDTISKTLVNSPGNMKGSTYKGASRFTGPKAIFDMLSCGLSRVCVLEEAGLMHQSIAGDQSGINRVLLDIYTSSGKDKYSGGEAYSDSRNSIPLLRSPALTVAHVSTPKSFLKTLKSKNSELSGEIARLWTIRSMADKEYLNQNMRVDFSKAIDDKLKDLMKMCVDRQSDAAGSAPVIDIELSENVFNDSNDFTDKENQFNRDGDTLRRTITSRAFAKSLKISSIISIFNGSKKIDDDAYYWARNEAVKKELDHIQDSITHESTDDIDMIVKSVVGVAISKCLKGNFNSMKKNAPKALAERGIFGRTMINQILCNNSVLKTLDDDTERVARPRKGLDKILDYMCDRGYLHKVSADQLSLLGSRVKQAYKITYEFELIYQ